MLRPWFDSRPPTSSMTKLPPRTRSARRRVARAAAALAPARRAEFRADQPAVTANVSVLGAAAERPAVGADAARRLSSPAPASPCSTQILRDESAVRRRAAPAPRLARRDRLRRRWRAIARILPRCATPNIFRPTPAGANQPRRARPSAVAPLRLAPVAVRRADAANRRRSCSNFRGRLDFEALAEALRDSLTAKKIRWRRRRARAPRR